MRNNDYLSEEEQFKKNINNEEISRIKDPRLRDIRSKYWYLVHKAFLDEHNIPDSMLQQETDKLKETEIKEIDDYRHHNKKV